MTIEIDIVQIYQKTKKILFHPNKFFTGLKKEKGKQAAFTTFAVLSLLGNVVGVISILFLLPLLTKVFPQLGFEFYPAENILQNILLLTLAYVLGLVGSFIYAGFLMLLLKLFTKTAHFSGTYRIYAYSWTPNLLLGWAPQLSVFAFLYSIYLLAIATKTAHDFSLTKTVMFILSLIIATVVVSNLLNSLVISAAPK